MWTYRQSTGALLQNGQPFLWRGVPVCGYSGFGACKNKPDTEALGNQGPIPRGKYTIGQVVAIPGKGPYCIDLHPHQGQDLHGRGGFLIHGDSIAVPGSASHGCIILPRPAREAIAMSGDRELEVVE